MGPTPLLDFFKRGEAARDVRLLAAEGALAPRAVEQLGILVLLVEDQDPEVRATAERTLSRIPAEILSGFLARSDVPPAYREFFAARGVAPSAAPSGEAEDPLVDAEADAVVDNHESGAGEEAPGGEGADEQRESIVQQIQNMGFSQRLKAAMKGTREMRAILVRDPNKMIAAAVLSSPKLTEPEVESIARMANVSEDILRIIGSNRAWLKNYSIIVGLTKNPKTPLAMSMNLMPRLVDRDLTLLSIDRNVPEPLRVAARKRLTAGKK